MSNIKWHEDIPNKVRGFELVKNAPADTKIPVRGSEYSAGYDMYSPKDFVIKAGETSELIHLNVKAYMQPREFLQLKIRSGMAVKNDILLCTSGVIDADFYENPSNDGNIGVKFVNLGKEDYSVHKGDRICQAVFLNYLLADNDVSLGGRKGDYGSTGV